MNKQNKNPETQTLSPLSQPLSNTMAIGLVNIVSCHIKPKNNIIYDTAFPYINTL